MNELTCNLCQNKVNGDTKNQTVLNLYKHRRGNNCFEQRVQNGLPPRTPNYKSPSNIHQTNQTVQQGRNDALSTDVTIAGACRKVKTDELSFKQEGATE